MNADEQLQREVTRAALRALDGTPFALAGSGAIREHGIIDRPTQDIDLFTSDVDAGRFAAAVGRVVDELRGSGHGVDERRRVEQFARLHVTTPEGRFVEIDMGVDSREQEPVSLAVGPVLSLDDAAGNKVSALYSRIEARDFLDVDAIRRSGKFTDVELIAAARERDPGFEVPMFAAQLDQAQKLHAERVADYGVTPSQLEQIKGRFRIWAAELRTPTPVDEPSATRGRDVDPQPAQPASSNMAAAREAAVRQRREAADRAGRTRPSSAPRPPADRNPERGAERE